MPAAPDANFQDVMTQVLSSGILLAVLAVGYIYLAITLMVTARKTGTPGGWMAWIPLLNLFLMCQIGRRSAGWLFLCLIPCVNVIAFAVLWSAMAQARGKPGWTGLLLFVPVVNLFLPAYVAMGGASSPAPLITGPFVTGPIVTGQGAAAGPPLTSAAGPRRCTACGTSANASDVFCGNCGQPLPAAGPAVAPPISPSPVQPGGVQPRSVQPGAQPARASAGSAMLVGALGIMAVAMLGCCGVGGYFLFHETSYTAPPRQAPQLPQRLAGTLTHVPLDTDPTAPARPTSVISQTFPPAIVGTAAGQVQVPQTQLPPGLDQQSLPGLASAVTSVTYRTNPQSSPINVQVLTPINPGLVEQLTGNVLTATNGTASGVNVQSPGGGVYNGTRIESSRGLVIILTNITVDVVICIYTPDPAMASVAERLAGNVGNGQGVTDPEFEPYICVLPAYPPQGLELEEMHTASSQEMLASEDLRAAMGPGSDPQAAQLMTQLQQILPDQATVARYRDPTQQEWNVLVCNYGSTRRSWWLWKLIEWTAGLNASGSTAGMGLDGAYFDDQAERFLIFLKGPYLVVLGGPSTEPVQKLVDLALGLQL